MDQMIRTYSCKRKTRRWPLVVFYMLDISAINAYVIWKALNPNWNSNKSHKRRLYLLQLGKELAEVKRQSKRQLRKQDKLPLNQQKKARCTICPYAKDRKTKTVCSKYSKNVCQEHSIVMCIRCQQN